MVRLLWLIAGYACGLFHTSIVLGKLFHFDVRTYGSGNTGTTNTLRMMGWKMGMAVLLGDALKAVIPMLVMTAIFGGVNGYAPGLIKAYTGLGAILGHNYPFYTGFRGGKGIATSLGVAFGFHPLLGLLGMAAFSAVFFTTHYASVSSLVMISVVYGLLIALTALLHTGPELFHLEATLAIELYVIFALIIFLAFFRHRQNIGRLARHEESKTYLSGKKKDDQK